MNAGTVLVIAVPVLVALAVAAFWTTSRRERSTGSLRRESRSADRSTAAAVTTPAAPSASAAPADVEAEARQRYAGARGGTTADSGTAVTTPLRPEELSMTRRQLFNRGIVAGTTLGFGSLGAGVLAFLWPSGASGFGSKINAGAVDLIGQQISDKKEPFYVPEARSYLVPYPEEALKKGEKVYDPRLHPGMEAGFVALFQKCVHLGCRVPWCQSSQWFECPCHGSKYNRVGEKKGGPAPRGLDRFPISVEGGKLTIDTGVVVPGPSIGTNTTGQEAEGPNCV